MPASEAQIRANQQNAQRSTGPKTPEGKERSRANALKHGLTGEGVALSNEDAAEVERVYSAFEADFRPTDEMGRILIRRAATYAVRMERSVIQETAALDRAHPRSPGRGRGQRGRPRRGRPSGDVRPLEGRLPGPQVRGRR